MIEGQKSGRMLRQGLLRLSDPTGEAGDLIEELGINVFDADGNMKEMHDVVGELEGGLDGMSSQAETAALSTIFGSESTAGWSALLAEGSDELEDYTGELENSEGAASDMADTMQDNAQGSIEEFQSAVEGLKIEFGEELLPVFGNAVDGLTDLVRGFTEMDDATTTTIAQTALMAAGVLGVVTAVASLTAGIGALMAFAGPVGLAIVGLTAGLGAIGTGIYAATTYTEENKKANLDNVEALNDQAVALENSADTFDRLSEKANISNSELGELYDINQQIADATHSEEVDKLQSQYDNLAEKSGLSHEELDTLFEANEDLIEQSPNIESSISDQGNAFVDNTDAVREYIDSLHEATMVEMETERNKALEQETELRKEIKAEQEEINYLIDQQGIYTNAIDMSESEIRDRKAEIKELQKDTIAGSEEEKRLQDEYTALLDVENGHYLEGVERLQEQVKEKRESVDASEEELAKIEALDEGLADILLKREGISETGQEGIITLEETIAKNKEKLSDLDEELEKNGELSDDQQEKYDSLVEQNGELAEAQNYITDELELYGTVNSLVESQRDSLSEGTQEKLESLEATHDIEVAEGNILEQIQNKNGKLIEEREQLVENRKEQGANKDEIDEQIEAIDRKIDKGEGVALQMLKELDILELVRDGIQLNGDQLVEHLEQLGYTTEEAYQLASDLSGETVEALKEGTEESGQAGKDKGDAHKDGIDSTLDDNVNSARNIIGSTDSELGKGNPESKQHGKNKGDNHSSGIIGTRMNNINSAWEIINSSVDTLGEGTAQSQKAGENKGSSHDTGLASTIGLNLRTGRNLSSDVTGALGSTTDGGGGSSAGSMFNTGLGNWSSRIRGTGSSVASNGRSGLNSVSTTGAGTNFASGFQRGMNNRSDSIWSTAWSMGQNALSALSSSIRTASPSRETAITGGFFTDGFAIGIEDQEEEAKKSATSMAQNTHKAMTDEIDGLARTFNGAAYEIQANKDVLQVEHQINNSGMESRMEQLSDSLDQLTELFANVLGQQQQQIESSNRPINITMDKEKVGRGVYDTVDKTQMDKTDIQMILNGFRPSSD
nr:phage tail tape measure protein [Virgibacillus natechei]